MSEDETISPDAYRPLPWQSAPWALVQRARAQARLAHAWIVSGALGLGRRHFVGAWVASLLCPQREEDGAACGICESCRMLGNGGHPDAHLLGRDGHLGLSLDDDLHRESGLTHWLPKPESKRKEIAVDGVRSLIERKLPLASHLGGFKVAVVLQAETLSGAAADALLKTIEEPPAGTYLILIADQALSLSATLRSRCQRLGFGVPPREAALEWLEARATDSNVAVHESALDAARGAPLRALAFAQGDAAAETLHWRSALDAFVEGRGDPLELASSIDKERAVEFLHFAQAWLTQRLRPGGLPGRPAEALARELGEAHRRLESNVPAQLALDALLIGWRRWLAPPARVSSESSA